MKEIKINNSDEKIYTFNAPTKLPVYMWVNDKKENTYISLVVRYGSTGTDFKIGNVTYNVPTGVAHYLEHIKFHVKDGEISDQFLDLGCDTNAYTSLRETVFEVFANSNIYDATRLLLNFVYEEYFTKKMIEDERGIILEEANSSKDNPSYVFYMEYLKNYLVNSNVRNPVIGTEKDIKQITLGDIQLIYNSFYRPENMFMVITGNFDPKKMEEIICDNEKNREFKPIKTVKVVEKLEKKELNAKKYSIKSKACINTTARLSFKIMLKEFKCKDKDTILTALRCILSAKFGSTSDFNEHLLQNNFATYFYDSVLYDDGAVGIDFCFQTEEVDKVKKLILKELKDIKITKEELKRIQTVSDANFIMKFDNIYNVAASMITSLIENNDPVSKTNQIIKNLTVEEINEIYSHVDLNNYMIGTLKPEKKEAK